MSVLTMRDSAARASDLVDHLVILAGGKGTRLSAMGSQQKVLLPIAGKPILQHQLELAAASGIHNVTIFAGYRGEDVAAFVADGVAFGLKARVLVETEPLGTAGAVLKHLNLLPSQFFVLYGDVMAAEDLQKIARFHLDRRADFTLVAHPSDHPLDSDLLEVDRDDRVKAIHVYPHPTGAGYANLVNAALYLVRRDSLLAWSGEGRKRDFMRDVVSQLISEGARVFAYRSRGYLKDMGTPSRFQQVESDYIAGRVSTAPSRARAAIFLDRDGTLNAEKGHLRSAEELELLPGAGVALRALRQAGFMLVVVTNQPVIARGEASESDVAAIHRRLEWELGKSGAYLDGIYVCPHHPERGFAGERPELKIACDCRKPATGLVERACRDLRIDITSSWMIGDTTRDMAMARRAGLRSVLLRTGRAGADLKYDAAPDFVVDDLAAAVKLITADSVTARS